MARGAARRRNASDDLHVRSTPLGQAPTQTKWWVRRELSKTPTSLISRGQTPFSGTGTIAVSSNCPTYAEEKRQIIECAKLLLEEYEYICPAYCQKAKAEYPARKVEIMHRLIAEYEQLV
jgi:hypothetical protein